MIVVMVIMSEMETVMEQKKKSFQTTLAQKQFEICQK